MLYAFALEYCAFTTAASTVTVTTKSAKHCAFTTAASTVTVTTKSATLAVL
jgi:hypothetical protein